ncbi:MAG: XisI protein [Blastocatellia bacterium]
MDNRVLADIAERVLTDYAEYPCAAAGVETRLLFDRERDQYALVTLGWEGVHHHYSVVAHLEIVNGKIRIQEDNTEEGMATDLEAAGVPKDQIILGFRHPNLRPYTEYAAA